MKLASLMQTEVETRSDAFTARAADWGRQVAAGSGSACERVSLDVVTPWPGPRSLSMPFSGSGRLRDNPPPTLRLRRAFRAGGC
jgi:hypothetical protein